MEALLMFVLGVVVVIAFCAAFARWVFRIGDIIDRLDKIVELLAEQGDGKQ